MYLAYALFCEGASDYSYFERAEHRLLHAYAWRMRVASGTLRAAATRIHDGVVGAGGSEGRARCAGISGRSSGAWPAGRSRAGGGSSGSEGMPRLGMSYGRGPRGWRGDTLLPAIAQRQSMDALRQSRSFQELERSLHTALGDLGVLETW